MSNRQFFLVPPFDHGKKSWSPRHEHGKNSGPLFAKMKKFQSPLSVSKTPLHISSGRYLFHVVHSTTTDRYHWHINLFYLCSGGKQSIKGLDQHESIQLLGCIHGLDVNQFKTKGSIDFQKCKQPPRDALFRAVWDCGVCLDLTNHRTIIFMHPLVVGKFSLWQIFHISNNKSTLICQVPHMLIEHT